MAPITGFFDRRAAFSIPLCSTAFRSKTDVIDIQIENPEYDAHELIYVPDTNAVRIRQSLRLVGWNIKALRSKIPNTITAPTLAMPRRMPAVYSNLNFSVLLSQGPASYFILKMLLPLLIVILVSIGALLLHPIQIDTRSSLPIGGLLTSRFPATIALLPCTPRYWIYGADG